MDMTLWLTDTSGADIRTIDDDYDFEIGGDDDSTFEIQTCEATYQNYSIDGRVYIPDTEFGGIIKETQSVTEQDLIYVRGFTWRGMLEKKIIEPPSGSDYKTVTGELNTVIRSLVDSEFNSLIIGSDADTGVSVSGYQFDRYCTLAAGLEDMLASVGYRLQIRYIQTQAGGYVEVSAVPAEDYSEDIELSKETKLQFTCRNYQRGVNHLICLGQGELKDRAVLHLYVNAKGKIGTTQYYTGKEEIAAIYDYNNADADQLLENGTKQLEQMKSYLEFDATANDSTDMNVEIGDTVSGVDSLTGLSLTKAISKKIVKRTSANVTVEYEVEKED